MSSSTKKISTSVPHSNGKYILKQNSLNNNNSQSFKGFSRLNGRKYQIGSFTPRFIKIFYSYLATKKKKDVTTMQTVLDNFQIEKIKGMSQKELLRDDLAEEIKKYKELSKKHNKLNSYIHSKTQKKIKTVKNNRANLLESLSKYKFNKDDDQSLKTISTTKMFKIARKGDEIKVPSLTERNDQSTKSRISFLDLQEREKNKKMSKTLRDKYINTLKYNREKIRLSCDFIMKESQNSIIHGKKTIEKFNENWDKYKNLQKFRFPETKLDYFNFNS